ncbi:MAG: TraR/DksA family transcriptional regulator [Hyphomicrobiaceae bacterium]
MAADLATRENQLRTRLDELTGRLKRIERHLEQTPNPDWQERAQEAEMDEVLEGLGHAGTTEVRAIRAALVRIKEKTYGTCVRCGDPISEARLDVLPHTPICRSCAIELEAHRR